MENLVLSLKNISLKKGYNYILSDVSFDIMSGEVVTLIGPNGSGKTSLVKIATKIQQPTSGSCWIKPNLRIGYVPQKIAINKYIPITVKDFLLLASKDANNNKISKFLDITSALKLVDRQLHHLSGGELQRVLLSRAMLNNPELLILDEPMQGIDFYGQKELYKIIMDIHNIDKRNIAVLMVSHDLHIVMATTNRVICLNKHMCCSGSPEQVKSNPEYSKLFRVSESADIAFYYHKHDHIHDISGSVIKSTSSNLNK